MPVFESSVDPSSEASGAQRAGMLALIDEMRALHQRTVTASARAAPLFERRKQLLPRERLARLLDPGAPFLELMAMAIAASKTPTGDQRARSAIIAGIGFVSGRG
jgi:geranyl-CoA carboxylase beta subunit